MASLSRERQETGALTSAKLGSPCPWPPEASAVPAPPHPGLLQLSPVLTPAFLLFSLSHPQGAPLAFTIDGCSAEGRMPGRMPGRGSRVLMAKLASECGKKGPQRQDSGVSIPCSRQALASSGRVSALVQAPPLLSGPSAGSRLPTPSMPSEGEPAGSPVSGFLICLIIDEFSA